MNLIFSINGGIGKTIAATAVCAVIKKNFPKGKLIVVSGYPEVFLNNPNVHRSFAFEQTSYFYQEYVEGKECEVFAHDPYLDNKYIQQETHLIKVWCEMFGLDYKGEQPEIFLTDREIQFNKNKYNSEKPIMLMQTNGGAENQQLKYSWARDIPSSVVVKIIQEFKSDYNIIHVRREDQVSFPFTTPVTDNFRSLVTLFSLSKKRLLMDSFGQHTAAALKLPSTVLWIANKPEVFGYDIHSNFVSNPFTKEPELKGSYLQKFSINGDPLQFPFNSEDEIFNVDEIIASLKKD